MGLIIGFIGLAIIGLFVWASHTLSEELKKIPEEYRVIEPHFAWFMLIPIAGLYFCWLLLPGRIPESIKRYHSKNGSNFDSQEDFGNKKGLYAAMAYTAMYVPGLDLIAWIPAAFLLHSYVENTKKLIAISATGLGASVNSQSKPIPALKSVNNAVEAVSVDDVVSKIERLKKLLDEGAITEDEYKLQKVKLLS